MRTPRVSETEPRTRVRKSGDRRSRVRRRAKKNGAGAGLPPSVASGRIAREIFCWRSRRTSHHSVSFEQNIVVEKALLACHLADAERPFPRHSEPRRDPSRTSAALPRVRVATRPSSPRRSEQLERTARRPPPRARSARAPSGNFGDVRRRLVPALLLRLRARTARGGDSGSGTGLASRSFACRGRPARAREARSRPPRRAGRRRGVRRGPPGRTDGAPGAGARGCASVAACASPDFRRGRRARCTAARRARRLSRVASVKPGASPRHLGL